MEFIFILFFHLLGDYVFQPKWMVDNKSTNIFVLLMHIIVYSFTLYIGLPLFILILDIFSGLPMVEFLITYELTGINEWDFDVFLYLLIGHFGIDLWSHKLSNLFHTNYLKTEDWKWEYFSNLMNGIDQFLHMIHLYIIFNIIFM